MLFRDRAEAGLRLSLKLKRYAGNPKTVVLGITRGGVAVAAPVATALGLPLDVVVVRKVANPESPEYALGAVDAEGNLTVNPDFDASVLEGAVVRSVIEREKEEALRREKSFRRGKGAYRLKNKTVILVDDGIATGATTLAAVRRVKKLGARRVVLAVPVGSPESVRFLQKEVDELVVLSSPPFFAAVGQFYCDFPPVSDDEVLRLI